MRTDDEENTDRFTPYGSFGRDEMNFAEFPIAALGKRNPQQKTLTFSDTIRGENGKLFPRTLTILASEALGLPTSADDEVMLGVIQLSAQSEFASPVLHFTRYQLIKLLGWSDTQTNYNRLKESLLRWKSITLSYDRAWWDNVEKSWVAESFAIIDNVSIYDRERRERRLKMSPSDPNAGMSLIKWNEVVFRSFQSGNVKNLNFDFYKNLDTPLSKRIFRFLDKRLYQSKPLRMDARIFACDHVGLSRTYDNTHLRRNLCPAIAELEQKEFIAPLSITDRFQQVARGKWEIVFTRAHPSRELKTQPKAHPGHFSAQTGIRTKKSTQHSTTEYKSTTPYPTQLGLPEVVIAKKNYQEPSPERRAEEKKLLDEFLAKKGWKRRSNNNESPEQLELI